MLSRWRAQGRRLPQRSVLPMEHGLSHSRCLGRRWSTAQGNGVVSFCALTGAQFTACGWVLQDSVSAAAQRRDVAASHTGMLQQSGQELRQALAPLLRVASKA